MKEFPLPPLPDTPWVGLVHGGAPYEPEWTSRQNGYTEEDMHNYARQAVLDFLAASVAMAKEKAE